MDTMTDSEARMRLESHHAKMLVTLQRCVDAIEDACATEYGSGFGRAASDFEAFLTQDLLPHAAGEESTLYAVARAENTDLIASMIDEHGDLRRLVDACGATMASSAVLEARLRLLGLSHEVSALFRAHARKEDAYLMPILDRMLPEGELGRLFVAMHTTVPA